MLFKNSDVPGFRNFPLAIFLHVAILIERGSRNFKISVRDDDSIFEVPHTSGDRIRFKGDLWVVPMMLRDDAVVSKRRTQELNNGAPSIKR